MAENSTIAERVSKAEIIVEALPYIKRFSGQTIVIKYGGSLMTDPKLRESFAADVVLLRYVGINVVIVHGGGKEITEWMARFGKEPTFVDGLRVTDQETMEIAEMVLSGKLNKEIVSLINQAGGKALGISGRDASLVTARRMKPKGGKDLGLVGEVDAVSASVLNSLVQSGFIPVISSVAEGKEREALNINADSVAAAVAIELSAEKLIFLTDVQGVMKGGSLIDYLDLESAERLIAGTDISGGMIPKLTDAARAIKRGVRHVHIISGTNDHAVLLELFTRHGVGTMIAHRRQVDGEE